MVILASNFRENIDDAYLRRFQAIVHFPMPQPGERLRLWQKAFPDSVKLGSDAHHKAIADRFEWYELSGADIVNVVHYCCLIAMAEKLTVITNEHLLEGIFRELKKLGTKS